MTFKPDGAFIGGAKTDVLRGTIVTCGQSGSSNKKNIGICPSPARANKVARRSPGVRMSLRLILMKNDEQRY